MLRMNGAALAAEMRVRLSTKATNVRDRVASIPAVDRRAAGAAVVIAAILNLAWLGQNGDGNLYYAAAVRSMLENWHNFFFVSFDPGGFVSIDKPPVDFWLQAASAQIFGLSGFSLALPQALSGIAAVGVLYVLVRRIFGVLPAFLAAVALAITPIVVASNRDNIVDSMLMLVVLLAAWAVVRAAETGRLRWLLLGAALVGLGFNIKMLEAYLVVPALALLYAVAAPASRRVRLLHLALAGAVLLVISLSWATAVDLTPANQRPFVGSSATNSELNLAFGYNGIDRLIGGIFGPRGGGRTSVARGSSPTPAPTPVPVSAAARAQAQGFSIGETGAPGPLRLFNSALGNQVSWLLVLALVGLLAAGWGVSFRRLARAGSAWVTDLLHTLSPAPSPRSAAESASPAARAIAPVVRWSAGPRRWFAGGATLDGQSRLTPPQQAWTLWGMWLLTMATFFSVASFFHGYYMVMMAPAIGALAGVGAVALWHDYRGPGWRGWLLPLALALTALTQLGFLRGAPAALGWVGPLIALGAFGAAALLAAVRLARLTSDSGRAAVESLEAPLVAGARAAWAWLAPRLRAVAPRAGIVVAVGVAALLLGPSVWAAATVTSPGNEMVPTAGPRARGAVGGFGGFGGEASAVDLTLERYLTVHQGKARYLFATLNATTAAPYVLQTGKPVMALGGFLGSDAILTQPELQRLIASGQVRYFLLSSARGFAPSPAMLAELPPQLREALESRRGLGAFGAFGRTNANSSLTSWVSAHCRAVPASEWNPSARSGSSSSVAGRPTAPSGASSGASGFGGIPFGRDGGTSETLYDCAGQ